MASAEDESPPNEVSDLRGESSETATVGGQWRRICRLAGWLVANSGLTWEEVLDLSPLRLLFVARAIDRRRALDRLAIFDAQAALVDEKSLNRLNRELRECQK